MTPTWCDSEFEDITYSYADRLKRESIFYNPLDREFEECYNTLTFEGAVEIGLTADHWEMFSHEVASFYEEMEKAYHDVLADQSR